MSLLSNAKQNAYACGYEAGNRTTALDVHAAMRDQWPWRAHQPTEEQRAAFIEGFRRGRSER